MFIAQNVKVLDLTSLALVETLTEADHLVVEGTILEVEMLPADVTETEMTARTTEKTGRGRTPGHKYRSDSRRRSDSRNDRHRARSVDHTETLGHEIVDRGYNNRAGL